MRLFRPLIYLWTLPTSVMGIAMTAATLASGGRAAIVDGVLEAHGGFAAFYLKRVVGLILPGGAQAITFGHVVLGLDQAALDRTRTHERVHVRQAERWGPLFVPAYFLASLVALCRGQRGYRDNWFEREAYAVDALPSR